MVTTCIGSDSTNCTYKYRTIVRSYITKMPGFLFTGFKQLAHVTLVGLVSYPTMEQMILDFNTTLTQLN